MPCERGAQAGCQALACQPVAPPPLQASVLGTSSSNRACQPPGDVSGQAAWGDEAAAAEAVVAAAEALLARLAAGSPRHRARRRTGTELAAAGSGRSLAALQALAAP
jgi:hypothetical protein